MTYSNYETIPDEILIRIFSFITNENLNNIYNSLLVSKRWNKLATFALYNTLHFRNIQQRSNFFRGLITNNEDEGLSEKRDKYLDHTLLDHEFNLTRHAIHSPIDDTMYVDSPTEMTIEEEEDCPIPMKFINFVKNINFGLSPNEQNQENEGDENSGFNSSLEWRQHCVNASLNIISIYCPDLVSLNLSGCQYYDYVLNEFLENSKSLMYLDVSYSSIKQLGLEAIYQAVSRTKDPLPLREINLSGIFRFWRLNRDARFLPNLIKKAHNLRKLIILDCPNISDEIIEECKTMKDNLTIVYETKVPIQELYIKKVHPVNTKRDSNMTLASNNEIFV